MEPILFPYTYLDEPRLHLLETLFGGLTVYQPAENLIPPLLARMAAEKGLRLRIPVQGRERELADCLADYTAWAAQQRGAGGLDSQFLRYRGRQVPFSEESAVTRLKSAIRSAASSGQPSEEKGESEQDRLFQARLFLAAAQIYDQQQWTLIRELSDHQVREQRLLDQLRDGSAVSAQPPRGISQVVADSPDAHQTVTRIQAWLRLWRADPDPGEGHGLWITTHPQIVDDLEAVGTGLDRIAALDCGLPVRGQGMGDQNPALVAWLAQLARKADGPGQEIPPAPEFSATEERLNVRLEVFSVPRLSGAVSEDVGSLSRVGAGPAAGPDSGEKSWANPGLLVLVRAAEKAGMA